jgi:NAD(P)-dependent dehydrogenase (short-subunit alcohol dehydrogenase family)
MLTHLAFTNFKSWPKLELPCGRITGLFGTNSSGKTSILQFLLLLKQTKEATDRALSLELNGPYVELGTIKDAIHKHDEALGIEFAVTFARAEPLSLANPSASKSAAPLAEDSTFTLAASLVVEKRAPQTRKLTYRLGSLEFSTTQSKRADRGFDLNARDEEGGGFKFTRTAGRPWPLPGPIKGYAFPDQARTYFQNAGFLSDLEAAYEQAMDCIFYLGPLREFPKRDYLWARSRPSDVGQRGDKAIDAILAATDADVTLNLRPNTKLLPFQQMIAHFLPLLRDAARAHGSADILTITSTAGRTPYETGGGYNVAKYGATALMGVLRLELAGEPIRVIEIAPGMVKTEGFALSRFAGDTARVEALYKDVENPLSPEDVAEVIVTALEMPPHVNLDQVTVRPVAQAAQHKLVRGKLEPK